MLHQLASSWLVQYTSAFKKCVQYSCFRVVVAQQSVQYLSEANPASVHLYVVGWGRVPGENDHLILVTFLYCNRHVSYHENLFT